MKMFIFEGVCGSVGVEHGSYVGVLKAVQVMLALQESLEPADVLVGGRIEAAIGALLVLNPAGTQPQELLCGRRVVGHGKGREILMALEPRVEEGIDIVGQGFQQARPVLSGELISPTRAWQLAAVEEDVGRKVRVVQIASAGESFAARASHGH